MPKLPDYGIDAPTVVRNNAAAGLLCWTAAFAVFLIYRHSNPDFAWPVLRQGIVTGAIIIAVALVMLWSSKVGKFRVRDRLLDSIGWRGNEHVLDIGCGRGLALIRAAKRLSGGKAVGIDLWSQTDLSGNAASATLGRRARITLRGWHVRCGALHDRDPQHQGQGRAETRHCGGGARTEAARPCSIYSAPGATGPGWPRTGCRR